MTVRARLILPLLVVMTALAATWPAIQGRFVYDDAYYVVGNPAAHGEASPWTSPLGSPQQALWRPLTVASYALQWSGAEAAGPFLIANVLLHVAVSLLVLALGRRLLPSGGAAFCGAILFAVHPVHAEAVAWVSGRAELLAALFVVGAWLAWLTPGRAAATASAALLACGLLSKESALVAPLLFVAGDLLLLRRPVPRARLALLSAVILAAWAARLAVLPQALPGGAPFGDVPLGARLLVALNILGESLRLCLWPAPLRVFHPRDDFLGLQPAPLLVLLAVALLAAWCWRRERAAAACLLLVPPALLTVLNVVPIGATFAARFLYLPSAFVCLAAGTLLASRARREGARGGLGASLLVGGALLAAALPACRAATRVFSSDLALWTHEAAVAPQVAHARYNHGYFLDEAGQWLARDTDEPGAADELLASLRLDPRHLYAGFAHQILGNLALGRTGRELPDAALAARHYRAALERLPDLSDARINLASIAAAAPEVVTPDEGLAALRPLAGAELPPDRAAAVASLRAQLEGARARAASPDSSTGTSSPDGS
jgi:hypothetical protein